MSAWGWLQNAADAVKKGAQEAQEKLQALEVDKLLDKAKAMEDKKVTDEGGDAPLPWLDLPKKWAGKGAEWEALVKGMIDDDATFLIGPERGMTKKESQALRLKCIGVDFATEPPEYYTDRLNPDILSYEPLSDVRFRLVPKFISEDGFWTNLYWKVREVGKLSNAEVEARALLEILNSRRDDMPEGPGMKRNLPAAVPAKTQVDAIIGAAVTKGAERATAEEDDRRQQAVVDIHEEGQEALALLNECMNDTGMDEHLQVAYDTCVSCRERIQAEIENTDSGCETTAFSRLLTLSGRLDDAIDAYDARLRGNRSGTGASATSGAVSMQPASPVHLTGSPTNAGAAGPEKHVDAAAGVKATTTTAPASTASSPKPTESHESFVKIERDLGVQEMSTASESGDHKSTKSSLDAPKLSPTAASKPAAKKVEFTALPWDSDDDE